jgi:hypothetical protein
MPWPATGRYDIDCAPGGLGLVQDLLNTIASGVPQQPDLLADLKSAQTWVNIATARLSAATGQPVPAVVLDDPGLQELRAFRDELHDEVAARGHAVPEPGDAVPRPTGTGPAVPRTASATLRLGEDGSVHVEPRGTGWQLLISLVLAALFEAQWADTRRRIKTCRNPRCRVAFYDRSRNNSGVWHSVRICGYPANLRAHRARQRGQRD